MMRSRVSPSERIGGRPRGLRTCSAICPIGIFQIIVDILNISPISENIKFPNLRTRKSGPRATGRDSDEPTSRYLLYREAVFGGGIRARFCQRFLGGGKRAERFAAAEAAARPLDRGPAIAAR